MGGSKKKKKKKSRLQIKRLFFYIVTSYKRGHCLLKEPQRVIKVSQTKQKKMFMPNKLVNSLMGMYRKKKNSQ